MDRYAEACKHLDLAGVPNVIVGAFGINLYAQRASEMIATADCDILVPAQEDILAKACQALAENRSERT
jgi:hypothetical protein